MKKKYNWGIIGPGRIARKFAAGLQLLPDARLYAVASRSAERATAFAAEYAFDKAYSSYNEMLADPDVDIVYIATTNNLHFEHTMMCLEAGKAVLCEKPFASNIEQVRQMVAKSQEKKVFLMEALSTRFMPSLLEMKRQIDADAVGKPVMLQCDFGFVAPFDPQSRIYAPELGGGSVPDIGIYPVFVAMFLFGKPVDIQVVSIPAPTGTDCTTAILFRHNGGEISMLTSSFQAVLENEARVYGAKGQLKLPRRFSRTGELLFIDNDGVETDLSPGMEGNGLHYEAAEVMACLDSGLTESPAMPLRFSLDMMSVLEEITARAEGWC